ncbi:MAG: ribbon-helix-helix domain-containing protein [Planctomycetes bacterium]|nr:ribbon-helix-helix domain-containing protein [Planctomycetota bacterium]
MAKARQKQEIVTFKANASLLEAMRGVPNRSEFIRAAVVAALDGVCPLCKGTGILTPNQKTHWETFAKDHAVSECNDCHELHLVCSSKGKRGVRAGVHK